MYGRRTGQIIRSARRRQSRVKMGIDENGVVFRERILSRRESHNHVGKLKFNDIGNACQLIGRQ